MKTMKQKTCATKRRSKPAALLAQGASGERERERDREVVMCVFCKEFDTDFQIEKT